MRAFDRDGPLPLRTTTPDEDDLEANIEAQANTLLKYRMDGSGPNLRTELTDMVREDPDAAAEILRTWIGEAN